MDARGPGACRWERRKPGVPIPYALSAQAWVTQAPARARGSEGSQPGSRASPAAGAGSDPPGPVSAGPAGPPGRPARPVGCASGPACAAAWGRRVAGSEGRAVLPHSESEDAARPQRSCGAKAPGRVHPPRGWIRRTEVSLCQVARAPRPLPHSLASVYSLVKWSRCLTLGTNP